MDLMNFFLSVGVIGGADGPTAVVVSGLPLPALTVAVFAVAFIAYVYIAKAVAAKKAPAESVADIASPAPTAAKPAGTPMPAGMTQGSLELINTDEKTAAVIMAIVSNKSGIPLNRLAFKSIKLMEDK